MRNFLFRLWFIKNLTTLLDEIYADEGEEVGRQLAPLYLRKFGDCLYYQNSKKITAHKKIFDILGKIIIAGVCEQFKSIALWAINEKELSVVELFDALINLYLLVFNGELKERFKEILCKCCESSISITELLCQSIETQYKQLESSQPQHHLESVDLPLASLLAGISHWIPFSFFASFLKDYISDLFIEQDASLAIQLNLVKIIGALFSNERISTQKLEAADLFITFCKCCNSTKERVRSECCEILPTVAKRVSVNLRAKDTVSLYNAFIVDESTEVQTAAKLVLGKLIAAYYPQGNVPPCLIEYLVQLSPSSFGTTRQPQGVLEAISFCFPGIVLAVGKDKWFSIRSCFSRFCKVLNTPVKKPLAAGLHEIASAISQADCEKDVFPVLLDFLSGTSVIKQAVLPHLHQIFGCFSDDFRIKNLELVLKTTMLNAEQDWIARKEISAQLGQLFRSVPIELAIKKVLPLIIDLCSDRIGIVRECALDSYYCSALQLKDNEELFKKNVIDIICMMKNSHLERLIRMGDKLIKRLGDALDLKFLNVENLCKTTP